MRRPVSGKKGNTRRRGAAPKPATRRSFLKLVAAGSAALMTGAVMPLARAAAAPSRKQRASTTSTAVQREIASQKAYAARVLKVIRDHPLPAGSDPAFTFRPLAPRRRRDR